MVAKCDGPISGFMEITHDGPIWTAYTYNFNVEGPATN